MGYLSEEVVGFAQGRFSSTGVYAVVFTFPTTLVSTFKGIGHCTTF